LKHVEEGVSNIPLVELGIPMASQEKLSQNFKVFTSKIVEKKISERKDTTKLLIELQDGHRIEVLLIMNA